MKKLILPLLLAGAFAFTFATPSESEAGRQMCPNGYRLMDGGTMRFMGRRDLCVKRLGPPVCPKSTRYKVKMHNADLCYNRKTKKYSKAKCLRQVCQTSTGRNCTETLKKDVCYSMLRFRCPRNCKPGKAVKGRDGCVCKTRLVCPKGFKFSRKRKMCVKRVCKVKKAKASCRSGYQLKDSATMRFMGRRDLCVKRLGHPVCPKNTRYKVKMHNADLCYNRKTKKYSKAKCLRQVCQTSTGGNCTEALKKDVCYSMLRFRCPRNCKPGKAVRGPDGCVCKVCRLVVAKPKKR